MENKNNDFNNDILSDNLDVNKISEQEDSDISDNIDNLLEDENISNLKDKDDFMDDAESKKEDKQEKKNDDVVISRSKLSLFKKIAENIKENNEKLIDLLSAFVPYDNEDFIRIGQISENNDEPNPDEIAENIVEGVFDGENMIGPDGKQYSVPANYASKSKLVEGDILKLTITDKGTFVYKQIGPIERSRVVGTLKKNSEGNFIVVSDGKKWRVIGASVTYFKGNLGDEVVLLIPKNSESQWGAVENIIRDNRSLEK